MKTNPMQKLLLVALATGGIAYAALENKDGGNTASPPNVVVDNRPVNRDGRLPASFSDIIKKITPSVVKVEVTGHAQPAADFGDAMPSIPFEQFGFNGRDLRRFFEQRGPQGRMPAPRQHGAGSGVIVTSDGYILTNNHVVDRADKLEITLHDGRSYSARVVGEDPKTDLAVVKVEAKDLPAITFADSTKVEVGDIVLAMGNSFGIGQSATMGMVSATGRATLGLEYEDFIQTDAAINPGNSGGALVDAQGRLVGINTAILSRSGGNDGVGFAIPSNMARNVMDELITDGKVTRAYLGVLIQDLNPALARQFNADENTQGALVGDVTPKSPAAKAGVENGDIITSIGGKTVKDSRSLKLAVGSQKPGEEAELKVLRNGEEKTLTAKLEAQSGADQAIPASMKARGKTDEGTLNGVSVADLDRYTRREANIPHGVEGALVTDVAEGSPAWEAGLRPGDVIQQINRESVSSAEEAVKLTEAPADRETLLRVWSRGGSRYITVDETAQN